MKMEFSLFIFFLLFVSSYHSNKYNEQVRLFDVDSDDMMCMCDPVLCLYRCSLTRFYIIRIALYAHDAMI